MFNVVVLSALENSEPEVIESKEYKGYGWAFNHFCKMVDKYHANESTDYVVFIDEDGIQVKSSYE